jgi:hypothetical protein
VRQRVSDDKLIGYPGFRSLLTPAEGRIAQKRKKIPTYRKRISGDQWRRGELNPGPVAFPCKPLRVYLVIFLRADALRPLAERSLL